MDGGRLPGWLAIGAALALGLLPLGARAQKTEPGGWNQGRVTAIAEALAEEVEQLHMDARNVPPDITFSQQRAQYELEEDLRLLKTASRNLASDLKAGRNREQTRPIFKRMEQLRADAEENARKTLVSDLLMDQILAVGAQLLQLQPYYREEPTSK
jgi:hypothetical protein